MRFLQLSCLSLCVTSFLYADNNVTLSKFIGDNYPVTGPAKMASRGGATEDKITIQDGLGTFMLNRDNSIDNSAVNTLSAKLKPTIMQYQTPDALGHYLNLGTINNTLPPEVKYLMDKAKQMKIPNVTGAGRAGGGMDEIINGRLLTPTGWVLVSTLQDGYRHPIQGNKFWNTAIGAFVADGIPCEDNNPDTVGNLYFSGRCGIVLEKVNAICGSAHNTTNTTAPSSNLCSEGNPSGVTGSGPWNWTCYSLNGGTPAVCSAQKAIFTPCGTANNTPVVSQPTINLCGDGFNVTWQDPMATDHQYNWTCVRPADNAQSTCSALKIENAVCGSTHNTTVASQPVINLCGTGSSATWTDTTATDNSYNWTCEGINNGTDASCSANKIASYPNCLAIKNANPSLSSGNYTVDPDGAGSFAPIEVYCDMVSDGGGWTKIAKKSPFDSFYYPMNARPDLTQTPLGWYDLAPNSNGTFSIDVRHFNTPVLIKLFDGGQYNAMFRTNGNPTLGTALTPILVPSTSAMRTKVYSLTAPEATNYFQIGEFYMYNQAIEGPCSAYDRNGNNILNLPLTTKLAITIQGGDWNHGSSYWCPNGLNAIGDYNFDGYGWNVINFNGSGSAIEIWIKPI